MGAFAACAAASTTDGVPGGAVSADAVGSHVLACSGGGGVAGSSGRVRPWSTVYCLFRSWQRAWTWRRILTALQAMAVVSAPIVWDVSVDSTVVRAHQHAAGARACGKNPQEPVDHGLGRSRGGWSTTIHLACDQRQRPFSVLVTVGQGADNPRMIEVLDDKAYSSRANRVREGSQGGRPPSFRPHDLQTTPRRGMRHQPLEAIPRHRHPVRQTRRVLSSHHPHRLHPHPAGLTSHTRSSRKD